MRALAEFLWTCCAGCICRVSFEIRCSLMPFQNWKNCPSWTPTCILCLPGIIVLQRRRFSNVDYTPVRQPCSTRPGHQTFSLAFIHLTNRACSTSLASLDSILCGGFHCGHITELVGDSASGVSLLRMPGPGPKSAVQGKHSFYCKWLRIVVFLTCRAIRIVW